MQDRMYPSFVDRDAASDAEFSKLWIVRPRWRSKHGTPFDNERLEFVAETGKHAKLLAIANLKVSQASRQEPQRLQIRNAPEVKVRQAGIGCRQVLWNLGYAFLGPTEREQSDDDLCDVVIGDPRNVAPLGPGPPVHRVEHSGCFRRHWRRVRWWNGSRRSLVPVPPPRPPGCASRTRRRS